MKNLFVLFFLFVLAIGCKKNFLEEEPKGRVSVDGFFNSSAELKLALTAMYAKFNETSNIDDWDTQLMGGDDVTSRIGSNKQDFVAWDLFKHDNTAERLTDAWINHYALISSANFILNGYESAVNATEKERLLAAGQAHFARAFAYFYIVRIWNRAPLVTTNVADFKILRSNPQDIYALIVADLKRAEELLPANWDFDFQLKGIAPTVGAAKSMLASVYLTMAGYPVKDLSKYALAAEKAKEVLDNSVSYGYSLEPNFEDLWRDRSFNKELIFGLIYNNASSTNRNSDRNIRAPYPSQPEDEGGWADYFAELNFFTSFPAGPRKDATFQTTIRPNATTTYDWTQGQHKHPLYKKMRAANGEGNLATPWVFFTWNSSRTNQVIRFAEVKLIYAEAKAMSSGVDASAYKEVNDVRIRAGLPELPPGLSQTSFRDAVVQERAWEFAGLEFCSRWYDLVRLELVEQASSNRHPDELKIKIPTKADYFSPVPITEVQINPNLAN
jgi:hypothetical protein